MPVPHLRSIRGRLTAWYTLVLGTLVMAFAAGSFVVIQLALEARTDRFLRDAADMFGAEVLRKSANNPDVQAVVEGELTDYRFREITFFVYGGTRLLGRTPASPNDALPSSGDDPAAAQRLLEARLRSNSSPTQFSLDGVAGGFRVASTPVTLPTGALTIAAVQSKRGAHDTLRTVGLAYLILIPIALVCSAMGGYWMAARSLAPVASIGEQAAAIGGSNLKQRLVAPNPDDELGRLAMVFNAMLDRLEDAFVLQQQFMQDASHELRSPVAALRMEAEVALHNEQRSSGEYREALGTIRHSAVRLSQIVDDLFVLARHDAERDRADAVLLDLGEIVHDAVRSLRPLATARGIVFDVSDPPESPVRGRVGELSRVVLNVVGNAVKFAPSTSRVRIVLSSEANDTFAVRITDDGPGIPEEARDRIFDRFFRALQPAGRVIEGAGLGLAIAKALTESHGGRLLLESTGPSGTTFAIVLPRAG